MYGALCDSGSHNGKCVLKSKIQLAKYSKVGAKKQKFSIKILYIVIIIKYLYFVLINEKGVKRKSMKIISQSTDMRGEYSAKVYILYLQLNLGGKTFHFLPENYTLSEQITPFSIRQPKKELIKKEPQFYVVLVHISTYFLQITYVLGTFLKDILCI